MIFRFRIMHSKTHDMLGGQVGQHIYLGGLEIDCTYFYFQI